jgi:hypothetical protein
MTSIISFFVLLLITYSYSVPVEKIHDSSTVQYDITTDKTMVDHELIHGEQSTGTPNIHQKRFNPIDIPPKQTIEEHQIYRESFRIQDIDRRPVLPIQDIGSRPVMPIQIRSTDDEELLITHDIDRRREPPVQGRSIDDEKLLLTQDTDRRRVPPIQGGLIDDEKLLTQDTDRRRVPPIQGGLIDNEELLPAQDIDRRREPSLKVRSVDEHDSDVVTTTDVYRILRTFEESSFPSTTIRSTLDYSSTHEENDKRSLKDEFSVRALESSAEFNRRAIRPIIMETTNELKEEIPLITRNLSENNIETTTNIKSSSEPSSSVDSFGKMTGLLHDSSNDVSTTTQSSFVTEHVQQLSQGQKQPIVETKKPN